MTPSPEQRFVALMPRRVAHAVHALLAARDAHGSMPVTTAEICVYDVEALTKRATAAALARARNQGLVSGIAGTWFATERGYALKEHLETRFLHETGAEDDVA